MNSRAFIVVVLVIGVLLGLGVAAYQLIASGRWNPANPSEASFPVRGIDVSRHQGSIDWPQVAASGVNFVFMKATEGGDWIDPEFERNWREAGEAGIARGAYHFYTFCRDPGEQAAHVLSVLPDDAELPFVVDVEYGGNCESYESADVVSEGLDRFMSVLTEALGYPPVIYAVHTSYPDFIEGRYLDSPLWLQNILWEPRAESGREWTIWQYSVTGRVPGIVGNVDLNVFNGDATTFEAFRIDE